MHGERDHGPTRDAERLASAQRSGINKKRDRSSWLVPGAVALPLLCCGLPALVAAGALTAIGTGLAARGFWLAAIAVLLIAGVVGGRWWVRRHRCEVPEGEASCGIGHEESLSRQAIR